VKAFLDTNILVYAQETGQRGDIARQLVAQGGTISVQILNELANVLSRKLRHDWSEVAAVLDDARAALDEPVPVTLPIHLCALEFARNHNIAFWDALILAAAIEAGCDRLYSEDFQHGRRFGDLTVVNPFLEGASR
jgi:predicted nucleic acid-binding protein